MCKEGKIKNNLNSMLLIKIVDDEWIDRRTNQRYVKCHWEEAINEINIGSINNRNLKILEFKYQVR